MPRVDINALLRGRPRHSQRGAPYGDSNRIGDLTQPCHLQRLRLVNGDYGADGTYWGNSPSHGDIWACFTPDLATLIYVRAQTRKQAADAALEYEPCITFIKGA